MATIDEDAKPHDPPTAATPAGGGSMSTAAKVLLASLSLGAGVIHLVMVPIHATGSVPEAIGFAIFGWAQVLGAIALVIRPSRALLQATVAVNSVAIILWIWSRTVGLPVGAHPGVAESAGSVDVTTVVFEAILVIGAAVLLARPQLGENVSEALLVIASIIPVGVLVATSIVLADPTTAAHSHTSASTTATSAPSRCDLSVNPAAYWQEAAITGSASAPPTSGSASGATSTTTTTTPSDGHAHVHDASGSAGGSTSAPQATIQGSPELDRLIAATTKPGGELKDAAVVVDLAKAPDAVYQAWLQWLPTYTATLHATTASGVAAPDDNSGHGGHIGPQAWTAMTDQTQCDQLARELATARYTALKYPTAADAKNAGWVRVTPYVPGIAAHYMNFSYVDDEFEIDKPEMLLYDGNGDDAHVVGLSYYVLHDSTFEPTQGLTGPNDHFHRHVGLCVGPGGVIGDSTMTAEQCAAIGGRKAEGSGGWMNHVWVIPGCESPWGVFSGANPIIDDALGASSGNNDGACSGSGVRTRYDLEPGSDLNTPSTIRG